MKVGKLSTDLRDLFGVDFVLSGENLWRLKTIKTIAAVTLTLIGMPGRCARAQVGAGALINQSTELPDQLSNSRRLRVG